MGSVTTGGRHTEIRELVSGGRFDEAWDSVRRDLLSGQSDQWTVARNVLGAGERAGWAPATTREIRLALLCTYEAAELRQYLRLACLLMGVDAEIHLAPYGQLEQELLVEDGALADFGPTHVLIAPTTADLGFPELADDPEELVASALARWRSLWDRARTKLGARVLQHGFVVPDETPLGHLSLRLPSSRISLVRELGRQLAETASSEVLLIDAERLAAHMGKQRWMDPRLWFAARQPYSHQALALLARETAAVIAADVGLAARCLVVDLDNTLWGGLVGEDGGDGVSVLTGPDGEAYAAFQEYLAVLGQRGVILAVASKNDLEAALEPFDRQPAMPLRREDFAVFVADWRPKSEQITEIAGTLGIGLDAIVFADDNPAECAEVAAALPAITTICLDVEPSERVRRLAACPRFELSSLAADDVDRRRSYAARAEAVKLRHGTSSIEEFWSSLEMRARVRPLAEATLDRAAQLTQKTNQFNLTLRRHSRGEIERIAGQDGSVCLTLELEDRFANHGLIGLGFLVRSPEDPATAVIDTLLLSCRVIGRTAEAHLLDHLSRAARELGYERLLGFYEAGPRNAHVADLYPKLGFITAANGADGWVYELSREPALQSLYIADQP